MVFKYFPTTYKNDKAIVIALIKSKGTFSSYISKMKRSLHFLLFTVKDLWDWKSLCLIASSRSLVSVFVLWLRAHHWGLCFCCNLSCQGQFIVCRYNLLVSLFSPLSIHLTILVSSQFVSCILVSLCLSPAALLLLPSKLKGLSQMWCLSLFLHWAHLSLLKALLHHPAFSWSLISWYYSGHQCSMWVCVWGSVCLEKKDKWSILHSM